MNSKNRILFFFLFIISNNFVAQNFTNLNQPLNFKHFSLSEGLSQSSVRCILQDSKGFLWFGTRDGLNKYDGHSFKTYRYNQKDKNSISNSFIKSILEDETGNIWVGTNNGLNKYIPHKDHFKRYQKSNNENSLINNEIWSLSSATENFLWVATNAGLDKFEIATGNTEHIKIGDSVKENEIRSIFKDSKNNLWICNTENITVYDSQKNQFKEIPYPSVQIRESNRNYVPVIYEDTNNTIWLGLRDGLTTYDTDKKRFIHFAIASEKTSAIQDEIRAIYQDFFGNYWIGTYNGLYIMNKEKTEINHFIHDENNLHSLSQNSVYSIIGDTKGDIWIGTYAGGINYFDRSFDVFKNYYAGTNNYKLKYKVVSSIIEESSGNLWIGTEGGGLNYLNRKTGKFQYYTHNRNNPNSISTNNVKSVVKTEKGNLWIGTHDGGLNFLNPNKKPLIFKKFRANSTAKNGLSNDRVISLFEDSQNRIWIGTSGGGLDILDTNTYRFSKVKNLQHIVGEIIYNIAPSKEKDVLLISGSKGLAKVDANTKEVTAINYQIHSESDKSTIVTLCAYEDNTNNYWIGTEGSGLFYYDTKTKKSRKYGTPDGLPNEVIYSILPDDYNNLWFSTNKGLSRYSIETNQFKNFDVSDGLVENEFNAGAKLKLNNKELMFGSTNGIVFFNPNEIKENMFLPPVYITSVSVNNKPYLSGSNITRDIQLTHKQNVFSFDFIALSYSQSDKNNYAYKLDGFDESWNYVGNKKTATYTNLDAGNYLFRVKASNNDRLWNEKGQSIHIQILPPFWKTWWAYLMYALVLGIVFYQIRKYSVIRILEKNELKRERLEKEKIEEINKLKLKLFTNISHDFRTPLTLIIGPLERMLKNKEGNSHVQKQHQTMYRNASVLLQLINQLLDFRKSESGKLKLKVSKNNITEFIENIKKSFDDLAEHRNIDYRFKSKEANLDIWFDEVNLKKVVFNLLSNAFKFTANHGKIRIKVAVEEKVNHNYVKIEIKDDGKGIHKKNLKFIFDRFYQVERDESSRSGTGIGLALAKSVVELHKGSIKVKSKENQGTCFTILLPMGKKHFSNDQFFDRIDKTQNVQFSEGVTTHSFKEKVASEITDNVEINSEIPTLLIVEDNPEVRVFIKEIFEENHNVFEAENGKVALDIAQNNTVDLIISDVMMPILNGIDFCDKIKTNIITSHIPVLLLTAKTSQDSQKQGYKIGADAYVTKPFDAGILEQKVKNLLSTRQNLIKKFKKDIILKPKELEITSADEIFLKKSIDLIENNINNAEFTIQDFISEIGMSRSALYRKLKALTGQSISEFIKDIKLKRAAQLIAQTNMNISEIAFDLGFSDLKHFRKSFKKQFNELPSQYRLLHENQKR